MKITDKADGTYIECLIAPGDATPYTYARTSFDKYHHTVMVNVGRDSFRFGRSESVMRTAHDQLFHMNCEPDSRVGRMLSLLAFHDQVQMMMPVDVIGVLFDSIAKDRDAGPLRRADAVLQIVESRLKSDHKKLKLKPIYACHPDKDHRLLEPIGYANEQDTVERAAQAHYGYVYPFFANITSDGSRYYAH